MMRSYGIPFGVVTALVLTVAMVLLRPDGRTGQDPTGRMESLVVTPAPSARAQLAAVVEIPDEWVVASATTQAPAPETVPDLEDSDRLVRRLAAGLSAHSDMASWLVPDGLIRRFVAATHAVAGGYSPREEVEFLRPDGAFLVQSREHGLVIAPSSFRRYDTVAEVFSSFDSDGLLRLYQRLEPYIEEAYREQPWHRGEFADVLLEAMDHLLATPVPGDSPVVERGVVRWVYADDRFEQLSDAQRHLLRMGPGNAKAIQAKLRELHGVFAPGEPMPRPGAAQTSPSAQIRAVADSNHNACDPGDQRRARFVDDSRSALPSR